MSQPVGDDDANRVMVRGAGVDIELLVFAPDAAPHAAVLLLHGWGETADSLAGPAQRLAGLGYLGLSMSMRGWGRSGGGDDCGLEQPADVPYVVEWMRSTYPTVGTRIGLLGISQGGQVSLLAAARGAAVAAVAAWAPVTDVAAWRATTEYPGIDDYIDLVCADGKLAERSPLTFADRLTVPVLLVHGDADTRVPTAQSRLLHRAINESGGRSRLELLAGLGHGGREANLRSFTLTASFFATHLLNV